MDVKSVELFDDEIEIVFADGSKEEIEDGFYERKNPLRETVEERRATEEDVARLTAFAVEFEANLPEIDAVVIDAEREDGELEVEYSDGSSEEIEDGVYEREGPGGRDLIERAATDEDIERLEALVADFEERFPDDDDDDDD
ncbi:MAG: hypothetical protein AAF322_19470, partial [Pseudomonadota bacterium]